MNNMQQSGIQHFRENDLYTRHFDDEIDLLELVAVIWRGKWIVLSITALCAVVGFFFLKAQPSIYRVEATVSGTTAYQIQPIQPVELEGGRAYQIESLDENRVYQMVLYVADSMWTKREFWQQETGQPLPVVQAEESSENEKAFKRFVNNFSIKKPDPKTGAAATSLYLESETPNEGIGLLSSYLRFVNTQVIALVEGQLVQAYQANIERLHFDFDTLKTKELQKLNDQLLQLNEAYEKAKALNIVETPYEQVENVELTILDNREYLLGTQVLSEETRSLEKRREKPIEAFVPKLRSMELWKLQLENGLKRLALNKGKIKTFIVLSPPESSLTPVKPNKLFIFVAIVFLAGFLSIVIVFVIHGIKLYQARQG